MTIKNLAASITQFDLERVVASLAPPNYMGDRIYTGMDAYWNTYSAIFTKFPKIIIQAWLAWRVISNLRSYTLADPESHTQSCAS